MNNYVRFVKHEPCPSCGSRDNLGVWSDGHSFCFGCGYRTGPEGNLGTARRRLDGEVKGESVPPLPEDVSTYIPEVPYNWLKKCLTDEEILKHRIGWSQGRLSVVFPVFDQQGNLLMWQSRYFGPLGNFPKYLTKGYKGDILHVLGEHPSNRVVLVEDLISAIVVSRVENSMPLWGSTIHLKTLRQLARYYGQIAIWLDSDKLKEAVKAQGVARLLFESVEVLHTEEDPKYQQQEQLAKILGEPLDKRDKPRYNLN
jgi:Zn ribbon nucleic-acid-binding protein